MLSLYNVTEGEVIYCQRHVLCAAYSSEHCAAQSEEGRKNVGKICEQARHIQTGVITVEGNLQGENDNVWD